MNGKSQDALKMRRTVALAEKALPALRARGIAGITAEELAAEMGISRATFFRYFSSKDEALLFAVMGEAAFFALDLGEEDLADRPLWPVLRRAMGAFDAMARAPDFRARVRLALVSPHFGTQLRLSRVPQHRRLVAEITARGVDPVIAATVVTAAVAVTDRCVADWARAEEGDLSAALDAAFATLARGY